MAGNQDAEAYRQHYLKGNDDLSGRNGNEHIGGPENA